MNNLLEADWSFDDIRAIDKERAERLENCNSSNCLVQSLAEALGSAINGVKCRVGVDSKKNKFEELRAIVQFPVSPELYDWFFNARTGYRAQFWISPEAGAAFNAKIVRVLSEILHRQLPENVKARCIEVHTDGQSRDENDVGVMEISRDKLLTSLEPEITKIWICERLISLDRGRLCDIGFATFSDAARSTAKLRVARWEKARNCETGQRGEGLRAPIPCVGNSWLDLKGGFLNTDGALDQIKSPKKRAAHISECGWT